jgi:hypothetical protein
VGGHGQRPDKGLIRRFVTPDYWFERDCRTPQSESYAVIDDEQTIGRVDLHYTPRMVHATLCVPESFTTDDIQELIETIDEELVDVVGIVRDEFVVHVFQGREAGVFSDRDLESGSNGRSSC